MEALLEGAFRNLPDQDSLVVNDMVLFMVDLREEQAVALCTNRNLIDFFQSMRVFTRV